MAAEPAPRGEQQASGPRSVAASRISGTVVTGDGARIDARPPVLAAGLPRPADVSVATGLHNLPRPPASVFVGRADVLSRLERSLSAGASVVVTQAVFGLGGVGKSELALQHAHAHRHRYPLTWWITADEPGKVEAGLAALAGRVCPDVALTATTAEAAAWALTWLQTHPGWLLILDDVNDPDDVEPLLGQLHGGHILLTTRRDAG
jgi:NB-ARC domain